MKPICVIYFPTEYSSMGGMISNWIYEYMAFLNGEPMEQYEFGAAERFKDYCWFCFYKDSINEPEFKVFHEKDFTEIQYQELKQLVEDSLKQQPCNTN
jgi:hypothetical protein